MAGFCHSARHYQLLVPGVDVLDWRGIRRVFNSSLKVVARRRRFPSH
jgi:hypothetical protein